MAFVRNAPELGLRLKQPVTREQYAVLYASPDLTQSELFGPATVKEWRVYFCKCEHWLETDWPACGGNRCLVLKVYVSLQVAGRNLAAIHVVKASAHIRGKVSASRTGDGRRNPRAGACVIDQLDFAFSMSSSDTLSATRRMPSPGL